MVFVTGQLTQCQHKHETSAKPNTRSNATMRMFGKWIQIKMIFTVLFTYSSIFSNLYNNPHLKALTVVHFMESVCVWTLTKS